MSVSFAGFVESYRVPREEDGPELSWKWAHRQGDTWIRNASEVGEETPEWCQEHKVAHNSVCLWCAHRDQTLAKGFRYDRMNSITRPISDKMRKKLEDGRRKARARKKKELVNE